MSDAILDTTVIIHLFRHYEPAVTWLDTSRHFGVTAITWLEVMEGARNKASQARCKVLLSQFEVVLLTSADQQWAMEHLERFQFSHHIGYADCLIAAVVERLRVPLYTHNLRDMKPLLGDLAAKPYK